MNALAITPWNSTPDELAQFIPIEIKKWAQVVKDAEITPERCGISFALSCRPSLPGLTRQSLA